MQNRTGCLFAIFKLLGSSSLEFDEPPELPYVSRPSLLTPAERSFYGVLCQAVGDQHAIFAKVRLADLVTVAKGVDRWQSHFNRISAKHVDFVLCDRDTLRPVLVIELDDKSHDRRQDRDGFVDSVLAAAGLPMRRIKAARSYSVQEAKDWLASK